MGMLDYYRQFEGLSEEEVNRGLRKEADERKRKPPGAAAGGLRRQVGKRRLGLLINPPYPGPRMRRP